jgi:hypothetical protein
MTVAKTMPSTPADLLSVSVTLETHTYQENLRTQLGVDYNDPDALNRALIELPARFAWWARLEAEARRIDEVLSDQLATYTARMFQAMEQRLRQDTSSGRGPTLDAIKSAVQLDPEHQRLTAAVLKIRADLDVIKVGRRALELQKDTLLGVASNLRAELDGRLTVKDRRAELEQARARAQAAWPAHAARSSAPIS